MIFKSFGEKVVQQRKEEALLFPSAPIVRGTAGVTVGHHKEGGPYRVQYDTGSGYGYKTVERGFRNFTDLKLVSEAGVVIDSQSVRTYTMLPDSFNERRELHAINVALRHLGNYAVHLGVPAEVDRTFHDRPQ